MDIVTLAPAVAFVVAIAGVVAGARGRAFLLAVVDEPHAVTNRREDLSSHQTGAVDIFAILALKALLEVAVAVNLAVMIAIALVLARLDASGANYTWIRDTRQVRFNGEFIGCIFGSAGENTGAADVLAVLALEALLEVAVAVHLAIMIAIALVLARFDSSRADHTRVRNTGKFRIDGRFVD
jgi:hypothetical protein